MKKYWIQIGMLVCGALLGFLVGSARSNESAPPASFPKQESAWIIIEEDAGSRAWKIETREERSLVKYMQQLAEEKKIEMKTRDFPGLGTMIEELNGKKNGSKGGYWQYWINEAYARVGAGEYIPQGGDAIEWRFTNQQNF